MGEYIKYKGEVTILGVAESLYYTTYQKLAAAYEANLLRQASHNSTPQYFLQPDSGYLFRFPFPDEDRNPIGFHPENDFRGIRVMVDRPFLDMIVNNKKDDFIYICQQKLFTRQSDGSLVLGTVIKIPSEQHYNRIEEEKIMMSLLKNIIRNHIYRERNTESKKFYQTLAVRILKGYRLETALKQKHLHKRRPDPGVAGGLKPSLH